jgi:general secretion pathway protein C
LAAAEALNKARTGVAAFRARLRKALSEWGKRPSPPPQAIVSLVEVFLVGLIAIVLARLFWTIWAIIAAAPAPDLRATPPQPAPAAVLADANPFRSTAVGAGVVVPAATAEAPETALDLRLHGTWLDAAGKGSAVIQIPGGQQKAFSIGDEVCCGATLAEVYADRVVISRGGAREALRLADKGDFSRAAASAAAPPAPTAAQGVSATQEMISVQAVSTADGAYRLQLFPGADPGLFGRSGLQAGDILVSVNGVAVPGDASAATALLGGLRKNGPVSLIVERSGQPMVVNVQFDGRAGELDLN